MVALPPLRAALAEVRALPAYLIEQLCALARRPVPPQTVVALLDVLALLLTPEDEDGPQAQSAAGAAGAAPVATSAAGATPPYQRAPSSSTVCTYAWCAFRPAFCAARMNEYVPVRGRPTSTTAFHISSRSIGAAGSARQARARRGRARRDAVVV